MDKELEEMIKERTSKVLFKGGDKGLCINCGKPRPKTTFAFCHECAQGIMQAMLEKYSVEEVVKATKIANDAVAEDIRQEITRSN